jgi:uncharacterized Zn-binding protein involved in type VI secretion
MAKLVRRGDTNSAGGAATSGESNFIVNSKAAVTVGTGVSRHRPCPRPSIHCNAKTKGGVSSFRVNSKFVNVVGDSDSCGHARRTGSPDFIIGN